ncbi:hypothetical protein CEQ36_18740 [Yersinia intermedia]|nr:hypothetical protein A6J67_05990 [Yersinia sp. FDAARGOS_228]AVL37424.1 hypothetical protein CEQ36_18740 [Yersinia intermedia]
MKAPMTFSCSPTKLIDKWFYKRIKDVLFPKSMSGILTLLLILINWDIMLNLSVTLLVAIWIFLELFCRRLHQLY